MGSCFSSESAGDAEQKKRSQQIDRKLEEDSRRLRRECKILLLGRYPDIRLEESGWLADFQTQDLEKAVNQRS